MSDSEWMEGPTVYAVDKRVEDFVETATIYLVAKIREAIATPYPPASEPYHPPHARTYELHESIGYRKTRSGYQLGSDSDHAEYVEFGTEDMEPRPFMTSTVVDELDNAARAALEGRRERIPELGIRPAFNLR